MRRYDYVLFDFDGTVADTGEGILKSLQYSFEQMGDSVPDLSELKKFIGPPIFYSYTHFYGVSEEAVGKYIEKYRERYSEKGVYECCLYPRMRELLQSLRDDSVKIGVASSKPTRLINSVMQHLEISHLFDAICGVGTDDSRHSTKTELVLQAMERLGARDKSRVLMVGDRYFDIDGAAGAGVDSCGVLYGYGSREEFQAHGATYIAQDTDEVYDIIYPNGK